MIPNRRHSINERDPGRTAKNDGDRKDAVIKMHPPAIVRNPTGMIFHLNSR
jgi:hypothetical protein